MPCGTERSDPVQMLKMTPVLPGAITENELITLTRTMTATNAVSTLLVVLARSSAESMLMWRVVLPAGSMGREVAHVNRRRNRVRVVPEHLPEQAALEP